MRGRLNRVLFYSFSYVRRASQHSDQWHGCSFIVAQYSTSNPSECRLKAVPTASGHLQFTGLSDASRNKNSGEKIAACRFGSAVWVEHISMPHIFFCKADCGLKGGSSTQKFKLKHLRRCKKRQQIAVSVFFHQQLTLFFKAWQHFTGSEVTVR